MSRDRARLKTALAQISGPCPFCDGSAAYVKWDAERRRHLIKVVHPNRTCRALVPGPFRDRADSFLTGLLELYGVRVAEYLEPDLVGWHDWR